MMRHPIRVAILATSFQIGCLSCALFAAELRVTLLGTDGRESNGSLMSISHELVRVGEASAGLNWSDVVWLRFEHVPNLLHEPRGAAIWLANGDRLIAQGTAIEDEQLHATWREFREWPAFRLPLETVRGLSLALSHSRERRDELASWLSDRKELRDELRLLNDDASSGEVTEWQEGKITLKTAGREVTLPITDVRDIAFNPELQTLSEPTELCWLVTLRDGSRITLLASKSRVVGTSLKASHVSGATWDIPLDVIFEMRVLRGKTTYLSDLVPIESRQTPFLPNATEWPFQRDRSVAGRPLRLGGREFPKGLGMHSRSTVTYDLAGKYRAFHATVGLDDTTVGQGTAVCAVDLDGRRVFDESELSRHQGARRLPVIDIRGVKRLTLIVDYGELGDSQDHVNWCDAVLLK